MNTKKIIAVIGATGAQGGGIARAILNDPDSEFTVRALTREPHSEKAKELERLGAEVVDGNISDIASLEKAFSGAYGAFLISFFWNHTDAARDLREIKNMAIAAKNTGLQHVVYSTLEDTRKFYPVEDLSSVDKYRASHMDVKGEGEQFFIDLEVPTTFLLTTPYWENFYNKGRRSERYSGSMLTFPPMGDKIWPGIAAEDIGKAAYGILKKGSAYIGRKIGVSGGHLTGIEYAESLSKVLGEKITFSPPTIEEFRAYDIPFSEDISNSFQFVYDFNEEFVAARNIEFTKSINPELQSFEQWAEANKDMLRPE
jgi:uncharacterized protein YbjT (DUF2867 family)